MISAEAAPLAAAPPLPAPEPQARVLEIRFTGSGTEYFRIWLLHLLLIVLTLGLYLPFAKARRLRYLHANTWIDGDALAFHGDARTMFRGFLVLLVLFGVYAVGGRFSPLAGYVAFLGLCVMWPALWRAGQQYRLANTSWRGLRLRFRGDLADAYSAFGVAIWPLVLMIGVQQFIRAVLEGSVAVHPRWVGLIGGSLAVIGGVGTLLYVTLLPLALARIKRYQHNHYQLADQHARMAVPTRRFYGLAAKTAGWLLLPLLALAALLSLPPVQEVLAEQGQRRSALWVMGVVAVVYLLGLVLIWPYFHARLQNLVWHHTSTQQLQFSSRLRFRSLAGLSVRNWLLTLLTLGLYRPFAVVATWRLRLAAMGITLTGTMDGWDGSDSAAHADASGEAAGDFFGIDLGL